MTELDQYNLNRCLLQQAKEAGCAGITTMDLHAGARAFFRSITVLIVSDAAKALVNLGLMQEARILFSPGNSKFTITTAGEEALR